MIRGIHVCQGCTFVTVGFGSGLLLSLIFASFVSLISWAQAIGVGLLSLIPAYFIDRRYSSRPSKRFARYSMGLGVGFGLAFLVLQPTLFHLVVFTVTVVLFYKLYRIYRIYHPPEDICQTCEYVDDKPRCPGYTIQLEANRRYSEEATVILSPDLERRIEEIRRTTDPHYLQELQPKDDVLEIELNEVMEVEPTEGGEDH